MKKFLLPVFLTVFSPFLFGNDDINHYRYIDSSNISISEDGHYLVDTCVAIDRSKQNMDFSPRYTITSASQTGENNILEIGMTEVRYVGGQRQEQSMFLYCTRFFLNGGDSINSHRNYLDVMVKWLAKKGYKTIPMPL
jgi:hypothetical protein